MTRPWHPLACAAFPVLSLYASNALRLPLAQLARPMACLLLGALAVWAAIAALSRRQGWLRAAQQGALLASALMLAVFSYGHVRGVAGATCAGLLSGALAAAGLLALRARGPLHHITAVANLAALGLVLAAGAGLLVKRATTPHLAPELIADAGVAPGQPPPGRERPDIYYIILDAYGRADRLQTFYGYDNTPFIRALEERGFYVAPRSRANYDQTALCLASALNHGYLDRVAQRLGPGQGSTGPMRGLIDDNLSARFLRGLGYRYIYVWTGTEATRVESADEVLSSLSGPSRLEALLLNTSLLSGSAAVQGRLYAQHRAALDGAFSALAAAARRPGPKFVFAHILAPHPPFVFGADGQAAAPLRPFDDLDASHLLAHISRAQYREGYIGQLRYINRRTIEALDAILRDERQPPIVIVQGDHGSRMNLDWEGLSRTDLREPFSVLNAYHVPAAVRARLYDGITPVNSFRVLLSQLFGAALPPLPDRSFYSTASHPFRFIEVTDRIAE